jgi:hypothetical protein
MLMIGGCASKQNKTYQYYPDRRPWYQDLTFQDEAMRSDLEILDISPNLPRDFSNSLGSMREDLTDIFVK